MGSGVSSDLPGGVDPASLATTSPEALKQTFLEKIPEELQGAAKSNIAAALGLGDAGEKIAYISDVEGHWPFFCNYVNSCQGLKWANPGEDKYNARTAEDWDLVLEDGWRFVFGGDACDKGPGTLRFVEAMVNLKKKYPSRVTLILGNRDINKMRWTSEITEDELKLDRVKVCPMTFWQPEKGRVTFYEYLRKLAAKQAEVEEDAVTDDMLAPLSTEANKLKYLQHHDMASAGEFEFRRTELACMKQKTEDEITDDQVVESYKQSLRPGGALREFLQLGQLGILIGTTLFVHGQILSGTSEEDNVWAVGVVPGEENRVEDVRLWLAKLNAWCHSEITNWINNPLWVTPPSESTRDGWGGRAAADLVSYATPGSRVPSVVYSRYLSKSCMPVPLPSKLTAYLRQQGIQYLVCGHTPHGSAPTVTRTNGVTMIMADTSFSHLKSNLTYNGDNRGTAVFNIWCDGTSWSVSGKTDKDGQDVDYDTHPANGDPLIGRFCVCKQNDRKFYVKARLADSSYLLTHIAGYTYEYTMLHEIDAQIAIKTGSFDEIIQQGRIAQPEASVLDRLQQILHSLNQMKFSMKSMIDTNGDGVCSEQELYEFLASRPVRYELHSLYPTLSLHSLVQGLLQTESFTPEAFQTACEKSACNEMTGVFFPVVKAGDAVEGKFPLALNSMTLEATNLISSDCITTFPAGLSQWRKEGQWWELDMRPAQAAQSDNFAGPQKRQVYVSSLSEITLPQATRDLLRIPAEARYSVFMYPSSNIGIFWDLAVKNSQSNPDLALVGFGGFAYLDGSYAILQVRAAMPQAPENHLQFGRPQPLKKQWVDNQIRLQKFHPLTHRPFMDSGVSDFCWVEPSAGQGSDWPDCEHGGFAYLGSQSLLPLA